MRLWLIGVFLIAVASKPSDSQQEECAIPGLDSYINRKENASTAVLTNVQTVATSVVPGLSNELGNGSTNSSDLYDALTTTLNVTTTSSFPTFEGALQEITDAYFLACYGEQNEKPTQDDLIPALQNLLMLLDALSTDNTDEELAMIRGYFGEISCLIDTYGYDNLLPTDTGPTDSGPTDPDGGTSAPTSPSVVDCSDLASVTVQAFYVCIGQDDIGPIFGIGYTPLPLQPDQSKRCVGFVVDTSGSMGDEIVEVRNNIKNFIDSQETLPACYVLADFNDYGSPTPSDNVKLVKVYDPSIDYGSDGSSLVRTDDLPVYGVQELKTDVDNLFPSGGGDCPEFGMAGILETLEAINTIQGLVVPAQGNLHHIITLTDASAKDDYLYDQVIAAANDAKATLHFFYSGPGCYGTFGNYETVRLATGGIAVTSFSDFDALSEFIQLYNEAVEATSDLSRKKRSSDDLFSEAAPSHTVYLNYLTDNLAILAQTTQPNVIIEKPDGQQETLPVSGVLALYTDDDPMPGLWTISVSTGILQVVISAPTLLQLDITYTTTDENGELVPTQDIPYACETGTVLVTSPQFSKISSDYPLYLNLLDSTGNILVQAELTECLGFHSVVVTFPNSPLVFYQLQGRDIGGNPFSKTLSDYDVTFRPPTLQASLLNAYEIAVNPGNTSFSKLELHYNQSHGGELNLEFMMTSSSSDLVTYYLDVPQSVKAGDKVYAVFETQASVNVVPGTSGYYVTASITDSCTGSALDFIFQVVSYQPVTLAVSNTTQTNTTQTNTTQTSDDRNLKISWQKPSISIADEIWQYSIYFDYNNGTYWQTNVNSAVLEYILIGLQPYQLVYVVVEAKSAANVILAKTPQFQFWSKEDVPGPVALLTYTTTGSTTVSVQWDSPTLPNGVILYYIVKLVNIADAKELNTSHVDALHDKIVTFKYLKEYLRYEIVIVGATSEGLGQSQQRQFYTIEGKPQSSPLNIRIRPITTTSANISWDPPSFQDRRGFIIRYNITISYNEQSGQQKVNYFYTFEEDNTSIIVEDLPQYARISVELSSATVQGDGPVSPPTPGIIELPPSAPRSLSGRPEGSSSVFLEWQPPANPNGILLGYSVFYRTEDSVNQMEQNLRELRISLDQLEDVNSPSKQVDELTSPATHSFYVTAYNSAGNGEKTEQTSVTLTDNTWIIILCGVMVVVVIITVLVVCCICCICCCCCMRQGKKSEKQGTFEVFHNKDDEEEKSATNPIFEAGVPDNVYEDMDKVLGETKIHANPPYHSPTKVTFVMDQFHNEGDPMYKSAANPVFGHNELGPVDESATNPMFAHNECGPVDESATNPVFECNEGGPVDESAANPVFGLGDADDGYTDVDQLLPTDKEMPEGMPSQETASELEKKRKPRKMGLKETMSELEKGWKLRQVPPKKTEAQLEMERVLKTVPDKIDHYEDIITKMGGTVAAGQTAAALQAANTEAYVNVGGDAFLSISTHQSQQQ